MPSDMFKWARRIEGFEDIPNHFKEYFQVFVKDDGLPYTILAPEHRWGRRKANEKMICIHEKYISYLERNNHKIVHKVYPLEDIIQIEHGKILLYSWIKISACIDNALDCFIVEYNTVTEFLFAEVITIIRTSIGTLNELLYKKEKSDIDKIELLEYKFKNYARYCLLPESEVIGLVFQQKIKKRCLGFLHKNISPTHLVMLTNKELIIIKEDDKMTKSTSAYCQIYNYIPLNKIKMLTVNRDSGTMIMLRIQLINETRVQIKYEPAQENALYQMTNLFH
ncbi:hypothetical protein [Geosporobacter ferrireducens]|uniref:hypothetical protein n=1 Tax=Geosporobacter ferrireducens TaxID=1424294 RepID=UPI00139E4AF7|nr:hypothetical protein [Geosporobacter ferrireducens]MTI58340.1 hypothetical protein [Geosporobacter ferrireducens]